MKDSLKATGNAILYLIVFVLIQSAVTMITKFGWQLARGDSDITADMLIATVTIFSVLTIVVFILTKWFVADKGYVRKKPYLSVFWCILAALGFIIPSVWLQEQLPKLPNLVEDNLSMITKHPAGYIAIGLIAPLAEEIVFRGAILKTLLQGFRGKWVAIIISAIIFSIGHFNPAQMPHAFIVGLLLGWMYSRTGSIALGVVYHWVNNTIAFIVCYIMPDPDIPLIVVFNGSETRVLTAVISSLCIFLPSLYQLHLRMGKE